MGLGVHEVWESGLKCLVETSLYNDLVTRNEQVVGSIPTGGSRSGPVPSSPGRGLTGARVTHRLRHYAATELISAELCPSHVWQLGNLPYSGIVTRSGDPRP
jgi:hypothetical protein